MPGLNKLYTQHLGFWICLHQHKSEQLNQYSGKPPSQNYHTKFGTPIQNCHILFTSCPCSNVFRLHAPISNEFLRIFSCPAGDLPPEKRDGERSKVEEAGAQPEQSGGAAVEGKQTVRKTEEKKKNYLT